MHVQFLFLYIQLCPSYLAFWFISQSKVLKTFSIAVQDFECIVPGVNDELIPVEHKSYHYLNPTFPPFTS